MFTPPASSVNGVYEDWSYVHSSPIMTPSASSIDGSSVATLRYNPTSKSWPCIMGKMAAIGWMPHLGLVALVMVVVLSSRLKKLAGIRVPTGVKLVLKTGVSVTPVAPAMARCGTGCSASNPLCKYHLAFACYTVTPLAGF